MIELGSSNVFLTKVWGFEPETYPFMGFSKDSRRSSYIKAANHGDWLIIVGTKQSPTTQEEQGRLLGLVQLGKDPLNALKVLKEIGTPIDKNQFNKSGSYKWPYALPFLRAFAFADKPDCKDVFGSYLPGFYWATNAVNLHDKFDRSLVKEIFHNKLIETLIHEIPSLKKAQIYSENLRRPKDGPTGPVPSYSRGGSSREKGKGYAYALKLVGRENGAFKIGFTSNLKDRIATLNKGLCSSVTGCSWKLIWEQEFDTEEYARNFEQLLHKHFKNNRFDGEMEIFKSNEANIQSAWTKAFGSKDWIQD